MRPPRDHDRPRNGPPGGKPGATRLGAGKPRADRGKPEYGKPEYGKSEHAKSEYAKPGMGRSAPDRSGPQRSGSDKPRYGNPNAGGPAGETRGNRTFRQNSARPSPADPTGSRPADQRAPILTPVPRPARDDGEAAPAGRRLPPSPGASAARGGLWLYGLHAVAAALANPKRRLRRLALTEEAEAALATRLPPPWSVAPERMDRARMDQLLGRDTVHQGMALLADPLAPPILSAVLERPGPVLVLDQVSDPRNVGAVLRSAAAFGAACCIVQDRNAPEETGALAKAASGALEQVPLLRAVNLARTLVALKAAGLWTVGLAAGAPPLSGPALADRRVVLVLGGEGDGLRRLTRETCDETAGLAMPGGMESLNVSAAATVALYELARR